MNNMLRLLNNLINELKAEDLIIITKTNGMVKIKQSINTSNSFECILEKGRCF